MSIIVKELLKITANTRGFDSIFARDLSESIGIDYRNWETDNMAKTMELKLYQILDTWDIHMANCATTNTLCEILSQTGRKEYNSLLNMLGFKKSIKKEGLMLVIDFLMVGNQRLKYH